MSQTIFSLIVGGLLLAFGLCAEAQQPKKIPRIGYVSNTKTIIDPREDAFRQALRDLGYIQGKNILFENRYIEGNVDQVPSLVAELVQLKVDLLVLVQIQSIRTAKEATKTIPIVILTTQDPVATGLVAGLAHPGGNITGLTRLTRELSGKRLKLLQDAVPGLSRVAVLRHANDEGGSLGFREYEAPAHALKIQLQSLEVPGSTPDLEGAFQAAVKGRANALITIRGPVFGLYRKQIADLAIKHRLASMYEGSDYVEGGGLMSYSANDVENFRRAAVYVDKILKGAKPAELPIEQPTKFEFVINLKTAKQIDLTIPPNVVARADRVIK